MKKLTKLTRKEIEDKWIDESKGEYSSGEWLCTFLRNNRYDLYEIFHSKVWGEFGSKERPLHLTYRRSAMIISETAELDQDETYLLRALTLNILLDDNEHLFEEA